MASWGSVKKNIVPAFFEGNNIETSSNNSLYGAFVNAIKTIFNTTDKTLENKYKIPTVVVIGAESSGKSSLLENITKCPVFPRNARICTKMPIHLKLKPSKTESDVSYSYEFQGVKRETNKYNICSEIEKIMNKLDSNTISNEIITVTICDANLPHFEFIDLPGIVAYPQNISTLTYNMAEQFILKPDTIILCVIPATTPRLTSYVPIALIKKHNKEKDTILVLTMCDRVQESNIYELIVSRLIGESDEFENSTYAGCTAVINRSDNSQTLIENNIKEKTWFDENIIKNIPKNFKNSKKLINRIATLKLIHNIDSIYNNYIQTKWIPKTLEELGIDKNNLIQELKTIGPIRFNKTETELIDKLINEKYWNIFGTVFDNSYIEFNFENEYLNSTTVEILRRKFTNNILSQIFEIMDNQIKLNFNDSNVQRDLKLERFTNFINDKIFEYSKSEKWYEIIYDATNFLVTLFLSNDKTTIFKIINKLYIKMIKNFKLNYEDMYENEIYIEQRNILNEKIENINKTIIKINNIK